MQNDLFFLPGHDVPPGLSRRDGTGQGSIDPVHVPVDVPGRRMSRQARAAAYQAWLDAGQPWPPPPDMGAVLDHALDACRDKGRGFRW